MNIHDTAGQERYKSLPMSHFRNAFGAIIVFSVIDRSSFDSVDLWVNQVREQAGPQCAIVLVANKADVSR